MFKFIDNRLNSITMYRLVHYGLIFIWIIALFLSFLRLLPITPLDMMLQAAFIGAVCVFVDLVFAWAFDAPTNLESVYITAWILILIISPSNSIINLWFFAWAAIIAMSSKYIIAPYQKHIFNPAALSVALTALVLNQSANWWVANLYLAPFVLVVGLLIVRKIRRFDLVSSFFLAALFTIVATSSWQNLSLTIYRALVYSPLMFFAFIMLTEPMTTPPQKKYRIGYGILVGFLFAPAIHLGSLYSTPELALLIGNIFSYVFSPKKKLLLEIASITELAPDVQEYVFKPNLKQAYQPGQYMELTLEHPNQDDRGIRRYFTLASSSTENDLKMGIKFYPEPSTFKKTLLASKRGTRMVAAQLAGDFVLPDDKSQKLVFMAGGIGITPFRSMIKYLIDTKQSRPIILLYSNKTTNDIIYRDVFDQAEKELGLKTVYAVTDKNSAGFTGPITETLISQNVPDFEQRLFFISGPQAMVAAFEEILKKMGIKKSRIKTDYFPGFA